MEFEKKAPSWTASGAEPPEELKAAGFQAGYKPPADYFNWFWSNVCACLEEMQAKLANVDETKDNDKCVAFAQEAGEARKTQYSIIVRLNGGRTEGTDQWTFDGSTGRTINITPSKIGAAASSHVHTNYLTKAGGVMSGTLGTKGVALSIDYDYGESFPTSDLTTGRLFFKKL